MTRAFFGAIWLPHHVQLSRSPSCIWDLVTLILITFVVYALIRHMPGTPLTTDPAMMNPGKMPSQADIKRWERMYGLDKPWYQAYFIWLSNVVRLDLGPFNSAKQQARGATDRRARPGHADAVGHVARADVLLVDPNWSVVNGAQWNVPRTGSQHIAVHACIRCRRSWPRSICNCYSFPNSVGFRCTE